MDFIKKTEKMKAHIKSSTRTIYHEPYKKTFFRNFVTIFMGITKNNMRSLLSFFTSITNSYKSETMMEINFQENFVTHIFTKYSHQRF
jgi:hypothetical protein